MKNLFKTLIFTAIIGSFASCDYLDIMPNETASEEDAFASVDAAERYLYSCYSYMPNLENAHTYYDWCGDEIVSCFPGESVRPYWENSYSSSNPYNGGTIENVYNRRYKGIRQCYLLKQNIANVPGITQDIINDYTNQADFLIAYYHMDLIKNYGPIVLVKELPDMGTPYDQMLPRSTYDECVNWVAGEFYRLKDLLPPRREGVSYGMATSVAAMALRSRLLLYAASPLFNGNSEYYSDFVNHDGTALIAQTPDANKWRIAAQAAKEAIDFANANGYQLYYNSYSDPFISNNPYPANTTLRQLRLTYIDQNSTEVLWANTRNEGNYSVQTKSLPNYNNTSSGGGWGVPIKMLERFYTKNGLPIDEDPEYNYDNRYGIVQNPTASDDDANIQEILEYSVRGATMALNLNREPRFYAWVSFHNGVYECLLGVNDYTAEGVEGCAQRSKDIGLAEAEQGGTARCLWQTQYKRNDNCGSWGAGNNFSPTGTLNKKGVHIATGMRNGDFAPTYYATPIIRLGELFLNYAEAAVGLAKDGGDYSMVEDAMNYLNQIRTRAGLPSVLQSWANAKNPLTSYQGNAERLMEIVQRERQIELYREGHNFWDMRRWKKGDSFGEQQYGMNINATTEADFCQVTLCNYARNFNTPQHYLMPIPNSEVSNNPQMVQNPGY